MQPVVPTKPSPARRRTSSFRFIMPLTGLLVLVADKYHCVARRVRHVYRNSPRQIRHWTSARIEEFNRDRPRAGGQTRHSETQELREIVPGARVGLRRGGRGENFADDAGG